MKQLWRWKDNIALYLGILFLLSYLFIAGMALVHISGAIPPDESSSLGPQSGYTILGACAFTNLIPSIIFFYIYARAKKKETELITISAYLKTLRRIGMADVAKRMGKPEHEAYQLLTEAIDKGIIQGFFDRTTGEFVVTSAIGQELDVPKCPNCGGLVTKTYLRGETPRCEYCGANLTSISKGPTPKSVEVKPAQPSYPTPTRPPYLYANPNNQAASASKAPRTCHICTTTLNYSGKYKRWYCPQCKK